MGRSKGEKRNRLLRNAHFKFGVKLNRSRDYVFTRLEQCRRAQKYLKGNQEPEVVLKENPTGPLKVLPVARLEPTEFNIMHALSLRLPWFFDRVLLYAVTHRVALETCTSCKTVHSVHHVVRGAVTSVAQDLCRVWFPDALHYFIRERIDNYFFKTLVLLRLGHLSVTSVRIFDLNEQNSEEF